MLIFRFRRQLCLNFNSQFLQFCLHLMNWVCLIFVSIEIWLNGAYRGSQLMRHGSIQHRSEVFFLNSFIIQYCLWYLHKLNENTLYVVHLYIELLNYEILTSSMVSVAFNRACFRFPFWKYIEVDLESFLQNFRVVGLYLVNYLIKTESFNLLHLFCRLI